MNEQAFLEAKIAGLENEVRSLKATLRDQYASSALTGLIAHYGVQADPQEVFRIADAMLEARKS